MEHFDKSWVRSAFLPHMGRLLLEQEEGLLPDTQEEAALVAKIQQLSAHIQSLPTNKKLERVYKSQPLELERVLEQKRSERKQLMEYVVELKSKSLFFAKDINSKIQGAKKKTVTYLFKCPHEECRGFVSDKYQCGTCACKVCCTCHVELNGDAKHKCKKEDKATAMMVMRETKPCPKCKTLIFKASGCNQMFCTQCHVAFDWESGQIDTGVIHNPHYYELLSKGQIQRNLENVACGAMPDPLMYLSFIRRKTKDMVEERELLNILRTVTHVRETVMRQYELNRVKDNFDLRVMFLLNEFDESTWAMKLMNREKKRMKIKSIRDLLTMVVAVMEDFVRQIVYESNASAKKLIKQYREIRTYYDGQLSKIQEIHGGSIRSDLEIFNSRL